jgi:hypothetical protein
VSEESHDWDDVIERCAQAAIAFAGHIETNPPAGMCYYDDSVLPAQKSVILAGIYYFIRQSRDQEGMGDPLGWAMLLPILRQYQCGVGPVPVGRGAMLDSPDRLPDPSLIRTPSGKQQLLEYLEAFRRQQELEKPYDEHAALEVARDNQILEGILGKAWDEFLRESNEEAKRIMAALGQTPTGQSRESDPDGRDQTATRRAQL